MAIIPWRGRWLWEPWENIDRWFEEWPEIRSSEFFPPLDVYEKGNKIIVETSIPGIEPEKVDISVKNNVLTIKGKSSKKSEVEDKNYYRKEVQYGSFYRSVDLPAKVIGEKTEATYEDGILKIEIPKAETKKEKKIKIKVKKSKK
ncbi:Hsp20/alpha crystallin family protein [bacterium]|nr:Hsp20/alpha crystallin family protein [bacterium]